MKFGISSSNLQYVKFRISSSSLCEVWDKFKQFVKFGISSSNLQNVKFRISSSSLCEV